MAEETITVVGHRRTSTQQYIRACSLIVGDASGSALDLSALRVEFTITHGTVQTPKTAFIRVTNVSKATAAKVQAEFTQVILSAGYQNAAAVLFKGQIRQTKFGRENPTDTYLDIIAADGDAVYSQGFINQTLAPGWLAADVCRELASAASDAQQEVADATAAGQAQLGITVGTTPASTAAGVRPKVMFGPVRDHCRVLATSTGTSWSVSDGKLDFHPLLPSTTAASATATVLSPSTGLIGIPHQTVGGVEATCLLNPRLKAGGYVKIDSSLITAAQVDTSVDAIKSNPNTIYNANGTQRVLGLSPSGTYCIDYVDHTGDTRGESWYSTVCCHAVDVTAVPTQNLLIAVP